MRKQQLLTLIGFIPLLLLGFTLQALAQEGTSPESVNRQDQDISIVLDQVPVSFDDPIMMVDDRLFVPIRHLAEQLGGIVQWEEEKQEVIITTQYADRLVFTIDSPIMTFNDVEYRMDVSPYLQDQRSYIPLRHAAEFLHVDVAWDELTQTADLTAIPLYFIEEGDSWDSISKKVGVSIPLLLERNQVQEDVELPPGGLLRFIIPSIMQNKIEEPPQVVSEPEPDLTENKDFMLLAKITQVEAGYEPYEGQIAVANVILNRVKDDRFPNSIHDVIYSGSQFPPAHNGLLEKSVPNDSVLKAVKAAWNGENNVGNALYFHNPNVSSGKFWDELTLVVQIGHHDFLK